MPASRFLRQTGGYRCVESGHNLDMYFVVSGDQTYGPADLATLKEWISEGRIKQDTELKDKNGVMIKAATLFPSMFSEGGVPAAKGSPGYGRVPNVANNIYDGQPPETSEGVTEFYFSLACSLAGCFFVPIILSVAGIFLGSRAEKKGHPYGKLAMGLGVASLIIGIILEGVEFAIIMHNHGK